MRLPVSYFFFPPFLLFRPFRLSPFPSAFRPSAPSMSSQSSDVFRPLSRLPLFLILAALFVPILRAADRPNILFIMVDEMKWNVTSYAGHPLVKTPHLDQLAREGTQFATAYTVAPICTPSRYSLFSSRYAHVHGSVDNSTPTREPQVLLPALLKHHGYQTAISGKLHFMPSSHDHSFDYFWSFANEGPGKLPTWPQTLAKKHGANIARKLTAQPFPDDPLGRDLGKLAYPKEDTQTSWITDRAVDFLQKERDPAKPFFLFVSYLDPHSPSHLAEPYWSMFEAGKMPLPPSFKVDPTKPAQSADNRHEVNDPKIVQALTAAYYAKVTMVDDNVGRLLQRLRELGLAENTLIVFTADHGNMLGDLNRWFKGAMYEGSARVPLLMKAPAASPFAATFNRGTVVNQIVENIDVMPTLCEMVGVPLPAAGIQGRSLTPLAAGQTAGWKNRAFAERNSAMVRTSQFKYIDNRRNNERHGGGQPELYDLTKDPLEMNNLATDASQAATLKDLAAQLEQWQRENPPVPVIAGVALPPLAENPAGAPKAARPGRKPRAEK
jgi:choline-sulfatase